MKRRKARKNRIRFDRLLIVGTAVIVVALIVFVIIKIIGSGESKAVVNSSRIKTTGVIIRDESSYYLDSNSEKFSRIEYLAEEGKTVEQGQEVATTYKLGFTDEVFQKLYNIQQEIYDEQMTLLSGVSKPEIEELQVEIDSLIEQLRSDTTSVNGEETKTVKELQSELSEALSKRSELLRSMVQPSEKLNDLYEQESLRVEQLENWTSRIITAQSGIFSSYSDGNEQSLQMKKIDRVTASQIKQVRGEKGYDASMGENDSGFMYRIIQDTGFAVGIALDKDEKCELKVGGKYRVSFADRLELIGECIKFDKSEQGILIIIKFDEPVSEFLTMRTIDVVVKLDS